MSQIVSVLIEQDGDSASIAAARHHIVRIDRPEAKGGSDKGPMGGELLLAGVGGCFMSNVLAAIKAREANITDVRVEVKAVMEQQPARFSAIEIYVSADYEDKEMFNKILTIAERACISLNTIKAGVELSVFARTPKKV